MTAEVPATPVRAQSTLLTTLRAYWILTKPTIIVLLLVTTVPAMVVAAGAWPDTRLVVATLIGGFLSAGGAGALNQFADRDLDAIMRRTRTRPVPAGIVSPRAAAIFGVTLGVLAALWLAWQVNLVAAALSVAAFLVYVGVYSLVLKRRTVQNIVIGGAAGAAPPLIGWAAVTGSLEAPALLLFLIVFYWTPPHFWALSLRIKDDYSNAGVPMMPVVWGEEETKRQILLYTYLLVALTFIFGALAQMRVIYFAFVVFGDAYFIYLALKLRHGEGITGAIPLFMYSMLYLALLFGAMMADELILG